MKVFRNTALTLLVGIVVLFFTTSGFKAFTSEGARRLHIEQHPITLPNIPLNSSSGEEFFIQDLQNKIVLVDFIFTNCTSICPMMTQNFRTLQKELQSSPLQEFVVLLTVSFDPDRDTNQVLAEYAGAVKANTALWKFATVTDKKNLQELLNTFGIVVIPAPDGQYEHNGAIHLINQFGKLAKIYDYAATELILNDLKSINHVL